MRSTVPALASPHERDGRPVEEIPRLVGLDLDQLDPADPAGLRRVKKARLNGVRGKGRQAVPSAAYGRRVRRQPALSGQHPSVL